MMRRPLKTRVACWLLMAVLVLILCSAGHDCHGAMEDHCPVCLVLSAWKLVLPGLAALAFFACLTCFVLRGLSPEGESCEKTTLVALKVKLSD